jgi:hypothetical protein
MFVNTPPIYILKILARLNVLIYILETNTHEDWLRNLAQGIHGFSGGATVRLGGSVL